MTKFKEILFVDRITSSARSLFTHNHRIPLSISGGIALESATVFLFVGRSTLLQIAIKWPVVAGTDRGLATVLYWTQSTYNVNNGCATMFAY